MSQENVETIKAAYERFVAKGEFTDELVSPDMVWDMSRFRGWVEQEAYHGVGGVHEIVSDWTDVWDAWEVEPDGFFDAGDKVIVIARQHSRSEFTKVPVEKMIAQVWTMRDGKATRMEGYSDPAEAFRDVGLEDN
ncbi:MAG: hypothetical protein QOI03_102 [Solirubrobacteraceae bacterium]|nr:hypothetical protein [Solirubrobacteraceae bacterium]